MSTAIHHTTYLVVARKSSACVGATLRGGKLEKFELSYKSRDLTKDNALNDIPLAEAAELAECLVELVARARDVDAKLTGLDRPGSST